MPTPRYSTACRSTKPASSRPRSASSSTPSTLWSRGARDVSKRWSRTPRMPRSKQYTSSTKSDLFTPFWSAYYLALDLIAFLNGQGIKKCCLLQWLIIVKLGAQAGMSTSYKGHTWGKIDLNDSSLKMCTMDENPRTIFNVDFDSINNATINKNDIVIESGAEIQGEEDCMCEIRFYVDAPRDENDMEEGDADKEQKEDQEGEDRKDKPSYSEVLYKKIIEKAKIGAFAGESILTLNDVNLTVPRGKYTIDFYQKNLRFHGQTYNFTIDYKNIMKGFLLPMENESQVTINLQLHKDKPIYQGQTLYRNILLQVKKDIEVEVKTRVKDKDLEKNPSLADIKEEYSGPLFQVLIDLIKVTSQVSLIAPDPKDFKSKNGQSCVKCGIKQNQGWLYFLKKSLIFIPKPVLHFKVEDIKKVQFNRLGANNKQFQMKITLTTDQKKAIQFSNIERTELDVMIEYFKSKNVRIEMEEDVKKIKPEIIEGDDDDSQEDGDFDGEGIDSEDDDQSFEQESISEGQQKKKKGKKEAANNESGNKQGNKDASQ